MCSLHDGFKLCTCEELSAQDADWILLQNNSEECVILMGEILEEYYPFMVEHEWVTDQLNLRNCFDFDYAPTLGDRLILRLKSGSKRRNLCIEYEFDDQEPQWRINHLYDNKAHHLLKKGRFKNINNN